MKYQNYLAGKNISAVNIITLASILIIVLGTSLRFISLEQKLFWHDEAISMTRIVGVSELEVYQFFDKNRHEVVKLSEFSQLRNSQPSRTIIDTIKTGLADSHVTPLYYILGHIWASFFGDSIATIRALSAVLGVGAIGAMFWCTYELSNSMRSGLLAAALLASSPFMVLYSQEARMYSLWCLTILISHGCFLRALRDRSQASWALYAFATAISFYSHFFTIFIAASHAIYVLLICTKLKLKAQAKSLFRDYIVSLVGSLILFSPWIVVILLNMSNVQGRAGWLAVSVSKLSVINTFLASVAGSIFLAPHYQIPFWHDDSLSTIDTNILAWIIILFFTVIIGLSVQAYRFERKSENCFDHKNFVNSSLFALCTIVVPILLFVFPSIILGKTVGSVIRYYVPIILGFQLGLAIFLNSRWKTISTKSLILVWGIICIFSLTSSDRIVSQKQHWSKGWNTVVWDTIEAIANIKKPILITTSDQGVNLLTLSYYLKPDTELLVAPHLGKIDLDLVKTNVESGRTVVSLLNSLQSTEDLKSLTGYEMETLQDQGDLFLSRLVIPKNAL